MANTKVALRFFFFCLLDRLEGYVQQMETRVDFRRNLPQNNLHLAYQLANFNLSVFENTKRGPRKQKILAASHFFISSCIWIMIQISISLEINPICTFREALQFIAGGCARREENWNHHIFKLRIKKWKWTWSSQLIEQPKWLKNNLKKFRPDREWNPDLWFEALLGKCLQCDVKKSFSNLAEIGWFLMRLWRLVKLLWS